MPGQRSRSGRPVNTPVHVAGLGLVIFGAGTFGCAGVGAAYGDPEAGSLALGALLLSVVGVAGWWLTEPAHDVTRATAFSTVAFTYLVLPLAATALYLLAGVFDGFVDAFFESVSGMTTTGSTVLADIEAQGKGVLLWRQFTQWYGGGGIVLLAVALLPRLGVGGLELSGAEIAGPSSDRIAPRVRTVARNLWGVYVGLTALVAIGLVVVGVGPFDAVAHAFATIPTAGFSTYNSSIGHFDSAAVEVVFMLGMLAGATTFTLHFRAARGDFGAYRRSPELRLMLGVFAIGVAVVTALNVGDGTAVPRALRDSAFNVTTTLTTTGFGTADFATWVPAAQLVLLLFMLTGGTTGSTSGGLKMLRVRVLGSYIVRELRRARHPRGVFVVRYGGRAVSEEIVSHIFGFVILYVGAIGVATMTVTALGSDLVTALGSVTQAIGLVGPGLGEAGPASNFLVFSDPAKLVIAGMMLLGRMEIFVLILALVAPARWLSAHRHHRRGGHPRAPSESGFDAVR